MVKVVGAFLVLFVIAVQVQNEKLELNSYQLDIDNRLALASQSMSTDIICKRYQSNPKQITVISIFPILCSIGQFITFIEQTLQTQFLEILNLKNTDEVYTGLTSMSERVLGNGKFYTPKYFSKAFADDEEPFCKKYTKMANSLYDETGVVDLDNSEEAAKDINKEVEKQGIKGFDKLVWSSDFDKKRGLMYISALEIMASFKHKLNPEQFNINFNAGNGKYIKIPGLTLKDFIGTAELDEMDATVYEFDLANPALSFVVFYPNKPDGLGQLVEKLREPKLFNDAFKKIEKKCLQVTLAKMNVRIRADIGESFQQIRNVSSIFEPEGGYFKGIQKSCSTHVSSILHESSLRLDSKKPALPPSKNDECGEEYNIVEFSHPLVFFYVSRTEKLLPLPVVSVLYYPM